MTNPGRHERGTCLKKASITTAEDEEEEETTDRLIFQCEKLRYQRNETIKNKTNKKRWW